MRKMISFKIENLSPKERAIVDAWANGQGNLQQSLANIIMHVVSWNGNADVMDFEVQRKLHALLSEPSPNNSMPTMAEQSVIENITSQEKAGEQSSFTNEDDPVTKAKKMDWD